MLLLMYVKFFFWHCANNFVKYFILCYAKWRYVAALLFLYKVIITLLYEAKRTGMNMSHMGNMREFPSSLLGLLSVTLWIVVI